MAQELMNCSQHTFTWNISNFNFLTQKKGESLRSPVFKAVSVDETTWYLELYPEGNEESRINQMACYLVRGYSGGPFEIECEGNIEIFRTSDRSLFRFPFSHIFKRGTSVGFNNTFTKIILYVANVPSFNDILTIKCYLSSNMLSSDMFMLSENTEWTKVNIAQCTFKWFVKSLNSTCLETVKFPCSGSSRVEISIEAPEDDIEVNIRRIGSIKRQYVMCRITLLDLLGVEHNSKQAAHLFEEDDYSDEDDYYEDNDDSENTEDDYEGSDVDNEIDRWKFPTFLKKYQLNSENTKFIKDDSFTLKFVLSVSKGSISSTFENKYETGSEALHAIPRMDNITALKADIKQMYTDKTQTDVELIVDKKVFPAHKFILSARSPVFLAMFNQDMMENKSGQVNICDLEVKTLDSLLEFMYTGDFKEMDCDKATKLLLAADRYQVLTLKDECSGFLKTALTDSNVCKVLEAADLVSDKSLRGASARYIKDHSKEVLKSDQWKMLAKNNLTLATDIFCEISTLLAEDSN